MRDLALAGYGALQRRWPAPAHRPAPAQRLWWALDHAFAMIPSPLLVEYRERWTAAGAAAGSERRSRGWVVGCWFSLIVWSAALSACVVGLRRHVRRMSRTARALHRRLGAIRTAMRALATARRKAAAVVPAPAPTADRPLPDPAQAGERLGMVATLCHEIRTPMHAVIGILELLMHKTAIRGETRYYIGTAHECAKSLITLVGDVLDMAKLEAGRLEIRPEVVQLPTLMRQLVHAFRPLAVSQHLRIRVRLGVLRGRRHRVDPQRLRQIVGNLLSNAIKYSHHGEIVVKLESTGDGVHGESIRIVVQDQGPGIDALQMPRLFEPFFRASGDGGASGTGLGLSISRQLARQMGGELEIVSTPGAGTTAIVTLVLPCAAGAGRAARAEARHAMPRRCAIPLALRRGYCALVVDDHPAGRMLLARQLGHLAVDAVCAGDGAEALALCASRDGGFDVVITDCNMPGMDGFELTRRLRQQERALGRVRVPVLGYSADARQQNLERALMAGMDDCLFKPIDLDSLARVLHRWLREMPACASRQSMPPAFARTPLPGVGPRSRVSGEAPVNPQPPPQAPPRACIDDTVPVHCSSASGVPDVSKPDPPVEADPPGDPQEAAACVDRQTPPVGAVTAPDPDTAAAATSSGPSSAKQPAPSAIPTDAAIREALLAGNASDLAAMRAAFDARDWRAMRSIAHRLKGATRLASAHAAAACCEAVEAACRCRDADAAAEAIASLTQRLDELAIGEIRF
nr:ATP-binding protein [Cupriavidus gilardii]